jgi:hypothetical protein
VVADAGEHVEQLALVGRGVADAVGGQQRQTQGARNAHGSLIAMLLVAVVVALQFDIHIARAEDVHQPLDLAQCLVIAAARQRRRQRAFVAAGQADQAFGKLRDIGQQRRALGLVRLAQLVIA